jgi:hypothetical protein
VSVEVIEYNTGTRVLRNLPDRPGNFIFCVERQRWFNTDTQIDDLKINTELTERFEREIKNKSNAN